MKVSNLQLYLRSLATALTASDPQTNLARDLDEVTSGLQRFAELDFNQLASLLRQADDYQRTGAISVPTAANLEVEKVQTGLRSFANLAEQVQANQNDGKATLGAERERIRKDLEQDLSSLLQPLGISVKMTPDKRDFESIILAARMRSRARQVREILHGATDETSLNTPERQQNLNALLQPLDLSEVKALALELGAGKTSSKSKEAVLALLVEKVTGLKAAKKTKTTRAKKPVDAELIKQEAVKFKGLLEKSFDPGAVTEAEVEDVIRDWKKHSVPTIRDIMKEAGLEIDGKKKEVLLNNIRLKLTEARRAQESIQV